MNTNLPRVMVVNPQLEVELYPIESLDSLSKFIGETIERGITFSQYAGMVTYFYNPLSPKVVSTRKMNHPFLQQHTYPLVLANIGADGVLKDLDERFVANVSFDYGFVYQELVNGMPRYNTTYTNMELKVKNTERTEETELQAVFIGDSENVIGEASITLLDRNWLQQDYLSYAREFQKSYLPLLECLNLFYDKEDFVRLDKLEAHDYEFVSENGYHALKDTVWGRLAIIDFFHVYSIYYEQDVISSTTMHSVVEYIKERFSVDCVILNFSQSYNHMDMYYRDGLIDDTLLTSAKIHFYQQFGFNFSPASYPVVTMKEFNLTEQDHFQFIRSEQFLPVIYGSAADYIQKHTPNMQRLFLRLHNSNRKNDVFELQKAFHSAAYHGDVEAVKRFIQVGFNPFDIDNYGFNAALLSVFGDQSEVFSYFLEMVSLNLFPITLEGTEREKEEGKLWLIEKAFEFEAIKCITSLLETEFDVNKPLFSQKVPLQIAIEKDCTTLVELLLQKGALISIGSVSYILYAELIHASSEVVGLLCLFSPLKDSKDEQQVEGN